MPCDRFVRHAEGLDSFSGDAGDVDEQKAEVGEDNGIPNGFQDGVDFLSFKQEMGDALVFCIDTDAGGGAKDAFDDAHECD